MPTHAWFTSFAPYVDPEIVVTVFVANGGEGSAVAAPIANEVLNAYFAAKKQSEEAPAATTEGAPAQAPAGQQQLPQPQGPLPPTATPVVQPTPTQGSTP